MFTVKLVSTLVDSSRLSVLAAAGLDNITVIFFFIYNHVWVPNRLLQMTPLTNINTAREIQCIQGVSKKGCLFFRFILLFSTQRKAATLRVGSSNAMLLEKQFYRGSS